MEKKDRKYWINQHGDRTLIVNLAWPHLRNIIKCLKGEGKTHIPNPYYGSYHMEWLDIMEDEMYRRGAETAKEQWKEKNPDFYEFC